MRFYNKLKFTGMICACAVMMTAVPFTASASTETNAAAAVSEETAQDGQAAALAQEEDTAEVVKTSSNEEILTPGNTDTAGQTAEEQAEASSREQLVNYALQFVGGRYKAGGSDPRTGTDCSGFTKFVMQHGAGVNLQRSSGLQATQGRPVNAEEMQAGDLIFYSKGGRINHVALYIGNGQVVHASTEKTGIKLSNWNYRTPVKIVSVLG